MLGQVLVSGLLVGGIYALVAVGLNIVFGVLRIINFAHGEYLMMSMYGAYWLWRLGVDPYLAIFVVVPLMAGFGALSERYLVRYTLSAHAHVKIFVTLGLSIALQNLALLLFKADYLNVRTAYQTATFGLAGLTFSVPRLVAFGALLIAAAGLFAFLRYTDFGKAIRATAQDSVTARLMGINVERIYTVTFAIGAAVVGVTGCLLIPIYYVFPTVGIDFVVVAFVVVVLGGLGSIPGAIVGGLLIGVVEQMSGFFVETSLRQVVYFLIFIAVLAVRPAGLFGQRGAEEIGLK
ncbi:MAG: branched-chain amino acid ABC transporter permease [Rhodospirillaceae bacterium]|nr:branched-chain amino acid ABC transporter permease [Rhodospirillaceae bacterium]